MSNKLSAFDCCAVIEGFDGQEHDQEEVIAAFQRLIDLGVVWRLQGFYGRTAQALIESGQCEVAA